MKISGIIVSLFMFLGLTGTSSGQVIQGFKLPSVSGQEVNLSSFQNKKAVVVIFSGNHCVYSKKYEGRIIALAKEYQEQGVQFVLINSNNPAVSEEDRLEVMKERAEKKNYPFPYLKDKEGKVAKMFTADKNPHSFVLRPENGKFSIVYQGAIDNNALMPDKANEKYLREALDAVLSGSEVPKPSTTPIGCRIK